MADSKIIERYSFNVPAGKTSHQKQIGGRGGRCGRNCATCPAFGKQCQGCTALDALGCPDGQCPAQRCAQCVVLCHRGGARLDDALATMGGLEIDPKPTRDAPLDFDCDYYPSIHKPLKSGEARDAKAISLPWHMIYDFQAGKPVACDLRDRFRIPDSARLIVNSYMKDDKVMCLFERLADGSFIRLLTGFMGVDYWHTPCFSVFDSSNKMDQALNFKRQFWAGDIMRDAGIPTIQEVLYTHQNRGKVRAGFSDALDLIQRKGIMKISQCGQLDSGSGLESDIQFYRQLPVDRTLIITGLTSRLRDAVRAAKCRVIFSDYNIQFAHKGEADYIANANHGVY